MLSLFQNKKSIGGKIKLNTMSHIKRYLKTVGNFSGNARSFLGCILLSFIALGAIQVILGLYVLELNFAEDVFGMIVSARIIATGLMAIPMGALHQKIGSKRILLLAALLGGGSLISMGLTGNKTILVLTNFLFGSSFAILFVMIGPFLTNNSNSQQREKLFSFNFVLMTIARTIGTFLVGFLPTIFIRTILTKRATDLHIYRTILYTLGAIFLLAIIPLSFIKESKKKEHKDGDKQIKIVNGLKTERIRNLSLYQLLFGIGSGLVTPFFSIFLAKQIGFSTGQLSSIMFVYRILMAVAFIITPILTRKIGKVKTVGITQVSSLPFLLAIVLVPNFAIVSFAFLIRGALGNIARPIASNFAMEITNKSEQTITSSLMRTSKSLARGGSATVAGWIITNFGYQVTYYLTFIFYLGSALLFLNSFLEIEKKQLNYNS